MANCCNLTGDDVAKAIRNERPAKRRKCGAGYYPLWLMKPTSSLTGDPGSERSTAPLEYFVPCYRRVHRLWQCRLHSLNLGNDRPNVSIVVRAIQNAISSYSDLDFLVPPTVRDASEVEKSFVYECGVFSKIPRGNGIV